jgi:transcriptional regulator
MYCPDPFRETERSALQDLMRTHPFATLVSLRGTEVGADHLPFVYHADRGPHGTLCGHVSRSNPLWTHFTDHTEVLVIFRGPDAYITPSWYPSKHTDGKAVPTWNYAVVHAYGELRAIEDREWLREHVTELTDQQEAREEIPWQISDAPSDYINLMLTGIIGIEISVARLEGKFKVSQNRTRADQLGVANGLQSRETEHAHAMASLVLQHLKA